MKRAVILILAAVIAALSLWSSMPAKAQEVQPSDIYSYPQIQFV